MEDDATSSFGEVVIGDLFVSADPKHVPVGIDPAGPVWRKTGLAKAVCVATFGNPCVNEGDEIDPLPASLVWLVGGCE